MQPNTSPRLRMDGVTAGRLISFFIGRRRLDQVYSGLLLPCGLMRDRVVPMPRQIQCRLVTKSDMQPVDIHQSSMDSLERRCVRRLYST